MALDTEHCENLATFSNTFPSMEKAEEATDSLSYTVGEGLNAVNTPQPDGTAKSEATFSCMLFRWKDDTSPVGTCLIESLKAAGLPFPKSLRHDCLLAQKKQASQARVQS